MMLALVAVVALAVVVDHVKTDSWVLVACGICGASVSIVYDRTELKISQVSAYLAKMFVGTMFAFFCTDIVCSSCSWFWAGLTAYAYSVAFAISFLGHEFPKFVRSLFMWWARRNGFADLFGGGADNVPK